MVIQTGRVCKGSLKITEKAVSFTIVYNSKRGAEESNFLNCVVFSQRQKDTLRNHLTEGQMIEVQGSLELWTDKKEDKTYYNTALYVSNFDLLPWQFSKETEANQS